MSAPREVTPSTVLGFLLACLAGFAGGALWLVTLPSGGDVGSITLLLLPAPFVLAAIAGGSVVMSGRVGWGGRVGLAWALVCGLLLGRHLWDEHRRDEAMAARFDAARVEREARARPGAPASRSDPRPGSSEAPRSPYVPPDRAPPDGDAILRDLTDDARRARGLSALAADPAALDGLRDADGALLAFALAAVEGAVREAEARERTRASVGAESAPSRVSVAAAVRDGVLLRETTLRTPLPELLARPRTVAEDRALLAGFAAGWLRPRFDSAGALAPRDTASLRAWLRARAGSPDPDLAWEGKVALEDGLPGLPGELRERGENDGLEE